MIVPNLSDISDKGQETHHGAFIVYFAVEMCIYIYLCKNLYL